MESRRCCKKHEATDRLWSLVFMVYVLCRIVDDPGPPKLLNLESSDVLGRGWAPWSCAADQPWQKGGGERIERIKCNATRGGAY